MRRRYSKSISRFFKFAVKKTINRKSFLIAKITLVFSLAFLLFFLFFLQDIFLKRFILTEIPPLKIKMIVSAYYHPLSKQKSYYTGSYWQDLALNGYGTTFSGKKVSLGYAAADLNYYPIGTKFVVPELGEIIVEDKGGAIQGPHRLDVFVGEGEEGLRRSIEWGRRELEVELLADN